MMAGLTTTSIYFASNSSRKRCPRKSLLVNSLPSTTGAAKYHALRVYLQVQQWLGNVDVHAEKYGWKRKSNECQRLVPITTDMDPAASDLLSKIRCQCKEPAAL